MTVLLLSCPAAADADWQNALRGRSEPVAKKLLIWLNATETEDPIKTSELIRFTRENPSWPRLWMFRDRVEREIGKTAKTHEVAAWFDQNAPKSTDGIRGYIGALTRLDHQDKAQAALRKFWLEMELDRKETAALASQYKALFSPTDHIDRMDALLWQQRYQEAEYMLPLVDVDHAKLAEARMGLGRMSSKAPKLVHAVPAAYQKDTGLLYDRLKWRRVMMKDKDAAEILQNAPRDQTHEVQWWRERNIISRRALEKKNYALAYKIIAGHGMTTGADYSQAEWTLGWIALRFLHQPDKAYQHFDHFYQAVNSAVSRSRAAYWLARAAEAMNQGDSAENWDKLGTQFPSTFYGQLSSEKMNSTIDEARFMDDEAPSDATEDFEKSELVQAVRLLHEFGQAKLTTPFFVKLLDKAKDRADFVLIAKLAREVGRLYFAVEANKQMQQKIGEFMFTEGYPLLPSLPIDKPEPALIHAIVHRESMFDTEAASSAGARGLMQLMPRTAKHLSKRMGKKFTVDKLTENPQYNIELGASYLQHLLDAYDGCYPLAIAAYNAGPSNVNEWIREFGDPRKKKINIIDWIESVPIYETRNYIQRVMESYYLYKLRFSQKPRTVMAFGRG